VDSKTFLRELKRRNVYKVATAYAVIAWLLIEAASILLSTFDEPTWVIKAFVVLLALGFAMIVFISWAFEATPEGMKRTKNVPPDAVLPSWSPRKFAVFIITIALLAASLLVFDLVRSRSKPVAPPPTAAP
jgi:adenylate cyclase